MRSAVRHGKGSWKACSAKLGCGDRGRVTTLSNECDREAWRNRKGLLPLPSLIGKQDYDEKDISTLRSEAPQQARLPQAHVYGQRPQRIERTSPQGTQEVVRELGTPPQRHRALKIRIQQPCAAKGNPTGSPFFMRPKQGATAPEPCTTRQTKAFRAPRHPGYRSRRLESHCRL